MNGIVVFVIKPFVLDIIRIMKQSDVEVTSVENQAESQIIAKISCAIRSDVLMSIMSIFHNIYIKMSTDTLTKSLRQLIRCKVALCWN